MTNPINEPVKENFTWSKFWGGAFNPLNFAKAVVMGGYLTLIIVFTACIIFTGATLFRKLKAPKQAPQPVTITTGSGAVHNSQDDVKSKWSVIGIF